MAGDVFVVRLRRDTQVAGAAVGVVFVAVWVLLFRDELGWLIVGTAFWGACTLFGLWRVVAVHRWVWEIGPQGVSGTAEHTTVRWADLGYVERVPGSAVRVFGRPDGSGLDPQIGIDVSNGDRHEQDILDALTRHAAAAGVTPEIRIGTSSWDGRGPG